MKQKRVIRRKFAAVAETFQLLLDALPGGGFKHIPECSAVALVVSVFSYNAIVTSFYIFKYLDL